MADESGVASGTTSDSAAATGIFSCFSFGIPRSRSIACIPIALSEITLVSFTTSTSRTLFFSLPSLISTEQVYPLLDFLESSLFFVCHTFVGVISVDDTETDPPVDPHGDAAEFSTRLVSRAACFCGKTLK